ncbi:hypothetical protein NE237_011953 [Protea cynaroides]|uniref:Uncharacterized protein n=1 Tax=Protea cynaroides TaxID=273540 RepID=A0A9Q0GX59_9MAGN|nr:hypothetical protein NE237_011953 [Protea cynaroides]
MATDCRHLIDVSSFFLFEATGDSESNSDFINEISKTDDNDAESCCQDQDSDLEDNNYQSFDQENYSSSLENESPEEVILDLEMDSKHYVGEEQARATVDAKENGELLVLNEKETNKLFWKKCLAS